MFEGRDKIKTGSQQLIKKANIRRIFNLVSNNKGISRAELANRTGLSPTTVSSLAEELISEGFIKEDGTGDIPTSGRKPIMLKVNPGGGCIAAADLQADGYNLGVFDLDCKIIAEKYISLSDYDNLGKSLSDKINNSINKSGYDKKQLMGICVGAPGIIDGEKGRITSSTILTINDTNDFYDRLMTDYPETKIEVVNESSLSAYAEKEYGSSTKGIKNLIYIDIHTGIGAGIIINGEIYGGFDALAGEFGHISVDLNGPLCKCGSRGCLETLASIPTLIKNIEAETDFTKENPDAASNEEKFIIIAKQYKEEKKYKRQIRDMAKYIAYGINNAINLINPGAVVIGGLAAGLGPGFLDEILSVYKTIGLDRNKQTKILLSEYRGNPVTAGGAKYIFNILF